jgi:hypothetical protein
MKRTAERRMFCARSGGSVGIEGAQLLIEAALARSRRHFLRAASPDAFAAATIVLLLRVGPGV